MFKEQMNFKNEIDKFNYFTRPKVKRKKAPTYKNVNKILKKRQKVLTAFESKIFPIRNPTQWKGIKILTLKQMLQRLAVALAEVKSSNTSEILLNEIRQII